MLVEVEKIARFPGSPVLAQVRTSIGHTAVRWCGELDAPAGRYQVEWEIDEEIVWGRNAKPAAEAAAGLQQGGHCVIVRGRLELTADGMGILDLDGALILLDLVDPIPREFSDTWVELYLQRENAALYPYDV